MARTIMKRALLSTGFSIAAISCGVAPTEVVENNEQRSEPLQTCSGSDIDISACEIKNLSDVASNISSIYSGAGSAIKLMQLLGLMDSPASQQQLFDELDAHLSRLGVSLGNQNQAIYRAMYLPNAIANAEYVRQLANLSLNLDFGSSIVAESRANAIAAEAEVAFQRIFGGPYPYVAIPNYPPAGQVSQSSFIPPRDSDEANPPAAQTGDLVYDWRLGVPELMQTIASRIAVLSSADPEWGRAHLRLQGYDTEMSEYRAALLKHYSRMQDGVKCIVQTICSSHAAPKKVWCEDVYTGDYLYYLSNCADSTDLNLKANELKYQLWQRTPLFEMRRMIDTLYAYANPAPDLTATFGQVPLSPLPNLCLDVPAGNPAPGTQVQLWTCLENGPQSWQYDRTTGRIYNPALDRCLEVGPASSVVPSNLFLGARAQIGLCGSPLPAEQKWTYDPEGRILRSSAGTVLDVQGGNLQAGNPVWLWELNNGGAQQWRADPSFTPQVNPPSECGRLWPGQGLLPNQSASSCDGTLTLTLQSDADVFIRRSITFNPPPPPPSPGGTAFVQWDACTAGSIPGMLVMQGDGNLVLYNARGGPVWASNTWNHPGAFLAIENTNATIYDTNGQAIWASNTSCQ